MARSAAKGAVNGCVFDEVVVEGDGTVTVEVKPAVWFNNVDFSVVAPSVLVAVTATRETVSRYFEWGFTVGTEYSECEAEQGGKTEAGVVVRAGAESDVQLTIHGDHLFYDRLQSSPDPAVKTSLRFDALAAADTDDDGEVTLAELDSALLDVLTYDPSGFTAPTHGAFVRALVRTIGHFRGEGECSVSAL